MTSEIQKQADKYSQELRELWDKIDCNSFKDRIPKEHKEEMYQIIAMFRPLVFKLEDFKDKLLE